MIQSDFKLIGILPPQYPRCEPPHPQQTQFCQVLLFYSTSEFALISYVLGLNPGLNVMNNLKIYFINKSRCLAIISSFFTGKIPAKQTLRGSLASWALQCYINHYEKNQQRASGWGYSPVACGRPSSCPEELPASINFFSKMSSSYA